MGRFLLPDWWLPASIGFAAGMLVARIFRDQLDQTSRQLKETSVVSYSTRQFRRLRDHIGFAGIAIIILAITNGITAYVAIDASQTASMATQSVAKLADCNRDYNDADSKATKPRAQANEERDQALQRFVNALDPFFRKVRNPGSKPASKKEISEAAEATLELKLKANRLQEIRERYPLPPSPETFCEG